MSNVIKISKGLDIPLAGVAEKTITEVSAEKVAIKPIDFIGVFPKPMVDTGDIVKAGTPLFYDKYRSDIIFTAPVSGKVIDIHRGEKRVLLEIVIEADNKNEYVEFEKADPNKLDRKQITERLLKAGVWPVIRQRPYGIIANPETDPKAIFISAFDTAPLGPDYDFVLHGQGEAFQAGLDALVKLTPGKVHLNVNADETASKVFTNSKGVQINSFSGPHPAGNVGTQIANISPLNKGETVWYLRPQDVLAIGRYFLQGKIDNTRVIALTGSEIKKPRYFRTVLGASIEGMIKDNVKTGNVRYISGNALTGRQIDKDGFVGFYDSQVTVIPEGDYHEFLGWIMPRTDRFSFSKSYFSWLMPKKRYTLDTNLNGGERAFLMTGKYEKVFAWDIYPMQLLKAILVEDIDKMEQLGIYEVEEEDFALCEFIDTSKTEMQDIIRHGLDLMRKEMM